MEEINYAEFLYYSEDSGTGLRWRIDRTTPNGGIFKRKDTEAGCFVRGKNQEKKCVNINLGGKIRKAHRIIWELLKGPIPEGMVIDHLDGDPWNNNISNLQCKTQKQNLQNSVSSSGSNIGVKGVRLAIMNGGANVYLEARVRTNKGKNSYESVRFSLDEFTYRNALEKAIQWRRDKLEEANAQGELYTERHMSNGAK